MKINTGSLKGRKINFNFNEKPRPTSSLLRESVFNILGEDISGRSFLDMFAGSGIMGFEAYSRGAQEVIFIDRDDRLTASIAANIRKYDVQGQVLKGDFSINLVNLRRMKKCFDIIYIDPPYFSTVYPHALKGCLKNRLLKPDGTLIVETHHKRTGFKMELLTGLGLEVCDDRSYGMGRVLILKVEQKDG